MSTLVDFIRANWHEVPAESVIPDDMEFAVVWTGGHKVTHYAPDETGTHFRVTGFTLARFTPEPLPEPEPEFVLPTEPGSVVIAHTEHCQERRVFIRSTASVRYSWADRNYHWTTEQLIDPEPASVVPIETWERLRVLDPEDTRDRVDRDGDIMRFTTQSKAVWGESLMARHLRYGPLRFADEGGVLDD